MSPKLRKWCLCLLAVVLLFGAGRIQTVLSHDREVLGLTRYTELKGAPPILALTTVALGGFRGLISNALWMRANDLQEDGKYFEMVQLADWITKLEPHFTQVWLVQGWNMAYNISVKFPNEADRWRWVQRGIELLRDEGLKYNPDDVLIHRELAWFFQHKMGANLDDAHMYYKRMWAMEMHTVLGTNKLINAGPMVKYNWDELIHPVTEDQKNRASVLINKFKMDPVAMKATDDAYGPLEWLLPETHAIYWAKLGLDEALRDPRRINPDDLITLRRVVYQSMQLSFQRGRLIALTPDQKVIDFGPNLEVIPKVSGAYEQAMLDDAKNKDHIETAHRNFLKDAVFYLYTYNRLADARVWFKYMCDKYPLKPLVDGKPDSLPGHVDLYTYVISRFEDEVGSPGQDKAKMMLEGLEATALRSLSFGEYDKFEGCDALARQLREHYVSTIPTASSNTDTKMGARLPPPSIPEIRKEMFRRLYQGNMISNAGADEIMRRFPDLQRPEPLTNSVPTEVKDK